MAHFILTYTLASDYLERRGVLRDEHLRLAWDAADKGALLLAGAVGDPPESALLVFTDERAARAFAEGDPYVRAGIVTDWRVRPWLTVVGERAATPVRPG